MKNKLLTGVTALIAALAVVCALFGILSPKVSAADSLNARWEGNVAAWDPEEGATGYEVMLYWRTWQTVFRGTVTDCSFDFTEYLHAGYLYSFAVRWVKGAEHGEFEGSDAIEIPGEPLPVNVHYEPESNYVYWDPVEGAEYYDLWVCDGEGVQIRLISYIPAETTEFNASEIVFNTGNANYTAIVAAYKDGKGNEFASGKSEPAALSITPDDYPTFGTSELRMELAPGEESTSGNVGVRLGGKYVHDARSYMKFEIEGEDAACFTAPQFGSYNYAELHAVYHETVGTAENIAPGEYHATLKLFYDPTATGKHWTETGSCALTLTVKPEESGAELLDTAGCTAAVPEAGAKAVKAVSSEPDKYSVDSIWLDAAAPDEPLPEDHVFEAGKKYILRVSYQANAGYEFAADAQFFAGDRAAEDFFLRPEGAADAVGAMWRFTVDTPATDEPVVTDEPAVTDAPVTTDEPVATDAPQITPGDEPDNVNSGDNNNGSDDNKTDRGGNKLGLGILIGVLVMLGIAGIGAAVFFILKKRG